MQFLFESKLATAGFFVAAAPAAHGVAQLLLWLALGLAVLTTLAWLLRQPGPQVPWPRQGHGLALLLAALAFAVQVMIDLGSGHSTLKLGLWMRPALHGHGRELGYSTAVLLKAAAMTLCGWGSWRLLRRR